jgi:hypothetical protein
LAGAPERAEEVLAKLPNRLAQDLRPDRTPFSEEESSTMADSRIPDDFYDVLSRHLPPEKAVVPQGGGRG